MRAALDVDRDAFVSAMAAGADWPQVFGPDRTRVARILAGIVADYEPTERDELVNALAGTAETARRMAVWRNGSEYMRSAYWSSF